MKAKSVLKLFAFAALFLFILGFAYPTVSSLVAEGIDPFQANGSLIKENNTIYGSYMLAQAFNESFFFQPRPSQTDYNYSNSGSGPYSVDASQMLNQTESMIREFQNRNPGLNISQIPYSMVSYSASGVDPDIPVLGAQDQLPRVVGSLHSVLLSAGVAISNSTVYSMLNSTINEQERENFPLFGSYYVNVVQLNLVILDFLIHEKVISNY